MKITFDKYTQKFFISFSESNIVAMTFEELEAFGEQIHQIVQDEYSAQLQNELGGDYSCDGCTI